MRTALSMSHGHGPLNGGVLSVGFGMNQLSKILKCFMVGGSWCCSRQAERACREDVIGVTFFSCFWWVLRFIKICNIKQRLTKCCLTTPSRDGLRSLAC